MTESDKKVYTLREYCKITGIHRNTATKWIKLNKLESKQKVKGGKHFIPWYELPTFQRNNGGKK